jgi:FkbM family methyltransferase
VEDLEIISAKGLEFYARIGSSDRKAIAEVVERGGYEKRWFRLGDVPSWLDIGANIGAFAVLAASAGCQVVAVECDPHSASLLRMNVKLNGLCDRVKVIEAAVMPVGGKKLTLHTNSARKNYWRNSLFKPWRGGSKVPVDSVSLADLPETEGCKIDAEGAEMPLLEECPTPWGRLVFEWSFDIDSSIPRFSKVISKVRGRYSRVEYPGFDETRRDWSASWFPPCRTVWCG